MDKKFYITTSIAYTNDKPHIGHALELIQADALARINRLQKKDTFFLTGTDDHGTKIYRSACKKKQSPKEFVDENIAAFKKLVANLNISNDDFISTSDKRRHWPGAEALWKKLDTAGDIYKKKYSGLYCVGCESYVTKADLVDGKCPTHLKAPEVVEEENYFFELSKYKKEIKEKIERDEIKITPLARKHEVLNIVDELDDISFSRPKDKLPWGVPVPGDDAQMMYVWCDALSNYITALGFGTKNDAKFKKYWPADVQCIGKDILKFHAVIWPAMLLAAGEKLPKNIFVHGYITSDGQKMSKSIGNVVDPFEVIEKYGADALRYFLLRESASTNDFDFSWKAFEERYNSDLANDLGNLVNRVVTMTKRYKIKFPISNFQFPNNSQISNNKFQKINNLIEEFKFDEVLKLIWVDVRGANNYIEQNKPWELAKSDPKKLEEVFDHLFEMLHATSYMLQVFLPETSQKIQSQLKSLNPEPLFPRIQ